ncbi:hypothetical protein [Nocardia vermiculata]|uniref:Uncharacterized protein n=1 Tax=Nocardia vermiculata TaxID=257274 RepID=A0A846XXX1_9NOCA|nr:hypothetical protein [Nocardia vermiculata]NKY50650.1 hypothetical protein [Nocardia vermiculata]
MPNTSAKSAKAIRAAAKSAPGGAISGGSEAATRRRVPWTLIGAVVVIAVLVVTLAVYFVPKIRHHAEDEDSKQSPTGQMNNELPAGIPGIPGIPGMPGVPLPGESAPAG